MTKWLTLMRALGRVGERNVAEVNRIMTDYFHARDALEPVSREDLVSGCVTGLSRFSTCGPKTSLRSGIFPARSISRLANWKHRLSELPADREVIAYCRGPYCVLSFEAVAALRARGYLVRRLEDGYPEWKAAGLPVEAVA